VQTKSTPKIQRRPLAEKATETLKTAGIPSLLARLYASRGIEDASELDTGLAGLLRPSTLLNADKAAVILADAIIAKKRIVCCGDFDADGVNSTAIMLRAFQMFGARPVDVKMPVRKLHGYGLSTLLVAEAVEQFKPDLIVTVDCGISSFEGVDLARKLGISTVVTDHHLPSDKGLPDAICIVNPSQPDDKFESKHLCGAGVIFYVMLALRAELRSRDYFKSNNIPDPNLGELLDLVALATVADVVKLDKNNRILVECGLKRIRDGLACHGIKALMRVSSRFEPKASTYDLSFGCAPRLNSSGRLDDMTLGLQCLMADDSTQALKLATELDKLNQERREIEADMKEAAETALNGVQVSGGYSLVMFDSAWHEGVIGILASRLKDQHGRPTIIFAKGSHGVLKGSGRSIPGFHLRDALDVVFKRNSDISIGFGGHAMAAGMTIHADKLNEFKIEFDKVVREMLSEADLNQAIETDGEISNCEISVDSVKLLEMAVWGQGFPQPIFDGTVTIIDQKILKEKHLKLRVEKEGVIYDAIWFFQNNTIPAQNRLVYSLGINEFNGRKSVQMLVKSAERVE